MDKQCEPPVVFSLPDTTLQELRERRAKRKPAPLRADRPVVSTIELVKRLDEIDPTDGSDVSASYSNIDLSPAYPGPGNATSYAYVAVDGHLNASSPCIDAGLAVPVARDMDNETRPVGASYDIGADEYKDTNVQGLPYWWQMKYFSSLGIDPNAQSTAGDG